MSKGRSGDGDWCPQDAEHGRMFAYEGAQRQYCPHSAHRGENMYLWDGKTPVKRKGAHI